jgi:paraquat-inducible protein A
VKLTGPFPTKNGSQRLEDLVVCRRCDGLFKAASLRDGEQARCPDCFEILQGRRAPSPRFMLATALTGVILLCMAIAYPVLTASVAGETTEVNILTAPVAFADDWYELAAWTLALVCLAIPLLQVALLSWLLAFAAHSRRAPGFFWQLPLLQRLRPWAMVEVFLLGSLIVITKVGGWVSLTLGPGLFSLAAFSVLLAAAHRFESSSLWDRTDLQ